MALFDHITHVVFDLDGLLIDSEPLWQRAETKALGEFGKAWNDTIAKQHIGLRLDEAAAIMVQAYALPVSASDFHDVIMADMFALLESDLALMPGAEACIKALYGRGLSLAIASSSPFAYIEKVVRQSGWGKMIPTLASGYDVPRGKPAPDVYLKAANLLNAHPRHCLALEDSLNGAKAAYAAGLKTVAIPGHGFTAAEFAETTHASFPDLMTFLAALP